MTLRLLMLAFGLIPNAAIAVSQLEIHIGEVHHPAAQIENVSATLDMTGRWQGAATLRQGDLAGLMQERALPLTLSKGTIKGKAVFAGEGRALGRIKADVTLHDVVFSDTAGAHAGEKVGGHMALEVQRTDQRWNWSGTLAWNEGEVYWQPWYIAKGGLSLNGHGWLTDERLAIEQARVAFSGVGEVTMACEIGRADQQVMSVDIDAQGLDTSSAYVQFIKPVMEKTLLGSLEMAGRADVHVRMRDSHLEIFAVNLHDFDMADTQGRFALYKVNAQVPWDLRNPTQAVLHYEGGQVLNMPLGATDLVATLNGYSLTAPVLRLPVLDGALTLSDVSAAFLQGQWHWHLGASLSPVSMADFSHAVGWPTMEGKVAASIPMVTYTNGRLTTDGAMGFDVFDGSVAVRNLALQDPLGLAPRLQADIQLRNLDLELLTRTFSFGAITGRLDGDVKAMELSRWQPVRFDADFHSSPGSYPKKISQRAVENISALGGAGAAAAIQRSFLKFFKEFNYGKIGLSCQLRNGVCAMDGVEKSAQGYVIVKGSGIPAITVLGYNQRVSWGELLERIKRITNGNASPVIK